MTQVTTPQLVISSSGSTATGENRSSSSFMPDPGKVTFPTRKKNVDGLLGTSVCVMSKDWEFGEGMGVEGEIAGYGNL